MTQQVLTPSRHGMGTKTSIASRDGGKSVHPVTQWRKLPDGHANQISMGNFCGQDEELAKSRRSYASVVESEKVDEVTFSRKLKL